MGGDLLDIDSARDQVLERASPLPVQSVPLAEAIARTLAEPVISEERVPGFDNSAMDGYAIRAEDVREASRERPAMLRPAGESRAGAAAEATLGAGQAIAISTGAVIPAGADTVVRVEDTERREGEVAVLVPSQPGAHVRRAGEDIESGDAVLAEGTTLGPAEIGVLASIGRAGVSCHRAPTVTVLSTGDELVGVEESLGEGNVRNSNSYALSALARASGSGEVRTERVGDDRGATVAAVERGLRSDVLVACGGVSVGAHDHVKAAFDELGVAQVFWGVSLKPGKPAWFGARGETLVFGLPGNPVSAYVTFLLLARPALLALQGADPTRARTEATLTGEYSKPTDRAHAVRCRLELAPSGWLATPAPDQGSHVMTSLLAADALALIPASTEWVGAGERVTIELLP
jgi:molybdopterin molybdotransferase